MKQIDKNALARWEALKESVVRSTPVDTTLSYAEREKHRLQLEERPLEWIIFFFGLNNRDEYAEFADFHKKAIRRITSHDEWFEVLSWSRELSKSTTVCFMVLYLALTGRKRNIIMASNSNDNAVRLLDIYRAQLECNERIKAYYGIQQNVGAWAEDEFVTRAGVSFRALGAGESPRGSRHGNVRPDVLLVDDFDTDKDCQNPDIVEKKWDWWERALYPTRSISRGTLIVFCGNIIARDCCVTRAGEMADHWDIINIRDRNGCSTWPLSRFKFLVIYGDPAPGENKTKASSTKAAMLLGKLGGTLYVIRAKLDRGLNAEFIDWYVDLLEEVDGKTEVYCYMENNKLQDPFFRQVFQPLVRRVRRERGVNLYIRGDEERKAEKFTRIEANLEPMNREGNLILNQAYKGEEHMKRREEQFVLLTPRLKFPADGPDCVEGGNRILDTLLRREEPPVKIHSKTNRKRNKYRI